MLEEWVTGDQFQGLKTDCLWAKPSRKTFCFVLPYFGPTGVKKERGWGREKKSLNALRGGAWSLVPALPLPLVPDLVPSTNRLLAWTGL